MFAELRRFLTNSITTDYIGRNLVDLLLGKEHEDIVRVLSNKMGIAKNEIAVIISSLYLFSYKVVIKQNALRLSDYILDSIYNSSKYHFIKTYINRYNIKKSELLVARRINRDVDKYIELYNQQQKIDFKEIIKHAQKGLVGFEKDLEISMYLLELIYRNITIIQDYLIDLSIKRVIIKNYKNKEY